MTEEEKKAIGEIDISKTIESNINYWRNKCLEQQKEIDELKDKNRTLETLLQGNLYEMYKYYRGLANSYQANCISKDKIREKIKECDKLRYKAENSEIYTRMVDYMDILQELLEEG